MKSLFFQAFEYFERNIRFRQLCRIGKSTRTLTKESKCRYQTKNSPYRLLMPFKEEDISSDPYVKMYHDVLSDEEIRFVTEMAKEDVSEKKTFTTVIYNQIKQRFPCIISPAKRRKILYRWQRVFDRGQTFGPIEMVR